MNSIINKIFLLSTFVLFIVIFGSCERNFQPKIIMAELIEVKVTEHSQKNEISQWLSPYKDSLDKIMNIKIGHSAQEMEAGRTGSLLGSFVTEVMKDYAKNHRKEVDFAITNIGGLRKSLPQGEITIGDVYKMFPFDNELVILTLPGKKVEQLCQEIAKQGGQVTNGIKILIEDSVAKEIRIGEIPLDTNRNYKVLTTDYLSFGNDNLFALKDYTGIYSFKAPLREIIIDYIKNEHEKGRMINAEVSNQILIK